MGYPRWTCLLVPYTRLELPGWGGLLTALGVYGKDAWPGAPTREIRGRWHGYRLVLDLSKWSERVTYFLGRYYDLPTQLFMKAALHRGETFVDVGANIGMITLLGAHLVGPGGAVHSFEPNPAALRRLRHLIAINRVENVSVHDVGLSDRKESLRLSVFDSDSGVGTFARISGGQARAVTDTYELSVLRGDDGPLDGVSAPAVVKIDVEGFECRVLRGMERTIRRLRPAIITETEPVLLERAGSSLRKMFGLLRGWGYSPYALTTGRRFLRHRLILRPVRGEDVQAEDVAWLDPGGVHFERVARALKT